ncbi:MAG: hypothetical protein SFX19_10385 [Alphaproteobacteria bacterium]|nr:hypothetical protein [Alphaproteobacteria bacterium]
MDDDKKHKGITPPQEPPKEADAKSAAPNSAPPGVNPAPNSAPAQKPGLSREEWDKSYKPQMWSDSAGGRLAIRTFSRGILGAMFFTAGGLWARRQLKGGINSRPYNAKDMTLQEIVFEDKSLLKGIAKIIDTCIGEPIEHTVNFFYPNNQRYTNGLRATHFKPTKYSKNYQHDGIGDIPGRSLGEEAVFVTWDFFVMSIGDALGRDIAGWVDPAQRKKWMESLGDEHGNFKWPETVSALCSNMWRYVSYNGGEDWFVAIPYVYFVRSQRHAMDRLSPGYGFESDISLNASSLKVNNQSIPYRVSGSYSMEAMLDYQSRFTVYNIGTLMYRELYDKIGNAIYGNNVNLYGAPDAPVDPNRSLWDKAGDVAKWVARSAIKGVICMTPAVPFFSITRATQNRENAVFIDPNTNSAMAFVGNDGERHFVKANSIETHDHGITRTTPVFYSRLDYSKAADGYFDRTQPMDAQKANPSAYPPVGEFDPYAYRHNLIENGFSALGRFGQDVSRSMDGIANKIDNNLAGPGLRTFKRFLGLRCDPGVIKGTNIKIGPESLKSFTRSFAKASMSYTPYMYMKAETARLWDSGKTDLALERTIDGAAKFDWKEFRAGLGETFDAILHRPFVDPVREAEAQRRILVDTSAADAMTDEEAGILHRQQIGEMEQFAQREKKADELFKPFAEGIDAAAKKHNITPRPAANLPWQERVVKGRDELETGKVVSTRHAPQSHSDREEMRKLLEEVQPPTNSVH